MFRLDGKTAIITGAGSGIGRSIAILFAQQGAHVAVVDVDEAAAGVVVGEIRREKGIAEAIRCDVSEAAQVEAAFAAARQHLGALRILVNNAGIAAVGNVEATTDEEFDRIYRTNVRGVFLCTREGVKGMVAAGGGVILNLASIASLVGLEDRFAYSMSKGAVLTMTRSVAVDYMAKGIRCNCVCPARVHTPFVDGYLKQHYPGREEEMFKRLSEYQPIGRMGKPEEVAMLSLYLCSDESAFVTGQAFPIDGGVLVK